MQIKHIDHLNLSVRDFDETAEWYGRVFGFEVVEQGVQDGEPWGVIKNGDAMLCIYQHPDWQAYDKVELADEGRLHISHFALQIADGEVWQAVVEREKLPLYYGGAVNWPHSTAWYVRDPNGYEIEVALWDDSTPKFG